MTNNRIGYFSFLEKEITNRLTDRTVRRLKGNGFGEVSRSLENHCVSIKIDVLKHGWLQFIE